MTNYLEHYGVPRRSGRYPWGSGEDPYHHGKSRRGIDASIRADRTRAVKNRRRLSDADLDKRINRLKKEKEFKRLSDEDLRPGRSAAGKILKSSATKYLTGAAAGAMALGAGVALKKSGHGDWVAYLAPKPKRK